MAKDRLEQLEEFEMVQYRMEAEGFHYCFKCYSSFNEIEDPKFHELRLAYLAAADALAEYVDNKLTELNLEEDED